MAWKLTNIQTVGVVGDVPQGTFSCDSKADVNDLPTTYAPNSIAIIADTDLPVAVLNASQEWKLSDE